MTIRILYIVAALIAAVWISYKIELSRGWTVFFTLLVSAAVGFLATITPLNYDEYVTTVKSYQTRVVSRYFIYGGRREIYLKSTYDRNELLLHQ